MALRLVAVAEIAGALRQSRLVPLIIAAVRSVSRCLLPNNYSGAVLTRGKKPKSERGEVEGGKVWGKRLLISFVLTFST